MPLSTEELAALKSKGTFTVRVVPSAAWLAIRSQQNQPLPWHDSVLRPLLAVATQAWAYELKPGSETFESASGIVERKAGKYAVDLSGEAVKGHELFWNASGGKRGSILLVIPAKDFPGSEIFPHCQKAFLINNSTVPHTPAAIRYARAIVDSESSVCCLLSRTNGLEWISFYASHDILSPLLQQAKDLIPEPNPNPTHFSKE